MITFVIPTWNRAADLLACVESIAWQNPFRVVISDNNSSDDTEKVAARLASKYPCVSYFKREATGDFSDSYKSAVLLSESEWTWTFGDDDILLPGALKFVSEFLEKCDVDFVHVAESKRVGKPCIIHSKFMNLCSRYGWLDVTGFISGNVVRTKKLKESVNSEFWSLYETSAFPQSLGLLEVMHGSNAALVECPVIDNQHDDATEDSLKRWKDAKVTYRYLLVADGLKSLVDRGVVGPKFEEDFFRYLDSSIFFRLMHDLVVRSLEGLEPPSEQDLERFLFLAGSVAKYRGEELAAWSGKCVKMMRSNVEVVAKMRAAHFDLVGAASSLALPSYGVQYIYDQEV